MNIENTNVADVDTTPATPATVNEIFEKQAASMTKSIEGILPVRATFGGNEPVTVVMFQRYTESRKTSKKTGFYDLCEVAEKVEEKLTEDGKVMQHVVTQSRKVWKPRRHVVDQKTEVVNRLMKVEFFAPERKELSKILGQALTIAKQSLSLQNLAGNPELKGGKNLHIALKIGNKVLCTKAIKDATAKMPVFSRKDGRFNPEKWHSFCSLTNLLLNEANQAGKVQNIDPEIAAALKLKKV